VNASQIISIIGALGIGSVLGQWIGNKLNDPAQLAQLDKAANRHLRGLGKRHWRSKAARGRQGVARGRDEA
jgi:hypothetical protein